MSLATSLLAVKPPAIHVLQDTSAPVLMAAAIKHVKMVNMQLEVQQLVQFVPRGLPVLTAQLIT